MQVLNANPRHHLTPAQVVQLLQSPNIHVTAGCYLLGTDLRVRDNITSSMISGSITRIMNPSVKIHGTCSLAFHDQFDYGKDLFWPYIHLRDGNNVNLHALWYLGVYALTSPEVNADDPERVSSGYDRLYFLEREVGDTYEVPAGKTYVQAMRDVITAAGLTGVLIDSSSTKTLPKAMTFPLIPPKGDDSQQTTPHTYRSIFNAIAKADNYNEVWCDWNGMFRSEPHVPLDNRPLDFMFNADEKRTMVGKKRSLRHDLFNVHNRYRFIQQNRPETSSAPSEGNGIWTYNLPDANPASAARRGLTWTKVVRLDAADQAALVAQGQRYIAENLNQSREFKIPTAVFPSAWHNDVYGYMDRAWGGVRKVTPTRWDINLRGSQMNWTWEEVG